MNVTGVRVTLSGDDVLSFIKQWVNVPGLTIEEVNINEFVQLKGQYKALIKIPFDLLVAIGSVENNSINLSVISLKVGKLKIASFIKNKISKKIISDFEEEGITYNENIISINIYKILKKLPIDINLQLSELSLKDNLIICRAEYIKIALTKALEEEVLEKEVIVTNSIDKTNDCYTKVKSYIEEKGGEKYSGILKYAFILPDLIALLVRLLKDKRIPLKLRLSVMISLGYLMSPIDIIPDFMPFIGNLDDLAVALFALNKIINSVPHNIILENWAGEDDIIELIKEGVDYIYNMTKAVKINRFYEVIEKLF